MNGRRTSTAGSLLALLLEEPDLVRLESPTVADGFPVKKPHRNKRWVQPGEHATPGRHRHRIMKFARKR